MKSVLWLLPPDTGPGNEAAGTTDSEEYNETMVAFYDRHVCRIKPHPDWVEATFAAIEANPEVYHTMNGPSEFHVIGQLKDFDLIADLGQIEVPERPDLALGLVRGWLAGVETAHA